MMRLEEPPKVLFSCLRVAPDGSAVAARSCYEALAGHTPYVDVIAGDGFKPEEYPVSGFCYRPPVVHRSYGRGFRKLGRSIGACLREWRRTEREHTYRTGIQYDLVIANDVTGHQALAAQDFENLHPSILILQATPDYLGGFKAEGRGHYECCMDAWKEYDGFVAISRYVADAWRETGLLEGKEVWVIPNSGWEHDLVRIAGKDRNAVRAQLELPQVAPVLVCPGSVQYRKGQDQVLRAIQTMPMSRRTALQTYCVGPLVGYFAGELADLAARNGAHQFHLLGPKNNTLEYMYAADLVIVPSRAEGQGLVVLEAMALKTPIVAAARGGIPEMIEDGVHGLLFDPDDPAEIAHAIEACLHDPAAAQARAEAAQARYWAEFSRERYVERWGRVLEEMTGCEVRGA